ncbi:uncharacterized protein LOC122374269 [Amphibalanus amphitrite]|uniref:uncharacterized protein LOC122374269 n=1 Tax=Amphibalanus amphitrite TaxID=1232801 RepID=UPI001C91D94D|nr:uncharacterized protein LOC122374269 [Amphibalanus amphitrite]
MVAPGPPAAGDAFGGRPAAAAGGWPAVAGGQTGLMVASGPAAAEDDLGGRSAAAVGGWPAAAGGQTGLMVAPGALTARDAFGGRPAAAAGGWSAVSAGGWPAAAAGQTGLMVAPGPPAAGDAFGGRPAAAAGGWPAVAGGQTGLMVASGPAAAVDDLDGRSAAAVGGWSAAAGGQTGLMVAPGPPAAGDAFGGRPAAAAGGWPAVAGGQTGLMVASGPAAAVDDLDGRSAAAVGGWPAAAGGQTGLMAAPGPPAAGDAFGGRPAAAAGGWSAVSGGPTDTFAGRPAAVAGGWAAVAGGQTGLMVTPEPAAAEDDLGGRSTAVAGGWPAAAGGQTDHTGLPPATGDTFGGRPSAAAIGPPVASSGPVHGEVIRELPSGRLSGAERGDLVGLRVSTATVSASSPPSFTFARCEQPLVAEPEDRAPDSVKDARDGLVEERVHTSVSGSGSKAGGGIARVIGLRSSAGAAGGCRSATAGYVPSQTVSGSSGLGSVACSGGRSVGTRAVCGRGILRVVGLNSSVGMCGNESDTAVKAGTDCEIFVTGALAHKSVQWLLDTGAQCTVVSEDVVRDLDLAEVVPERSPVTVDGSAMPLVKVVSCDVTVGGKTVRDHPIYVVRNLDPHCLLGMDVLERMGSHVSIDLRKKVATVRRCQVLADAGRVKMSHSVCIPPKHEAVLLCCVPDTVAVGDTVVTEHSPVLSDKFGIMSAAGVAVVGESRTIPVRVVNPSERGILLPAQTEVAMIAENAALREVDHITSKEEAKVRLLGVDDTAVTAWVERMVSKSDLVSDADKNVFRDLLLKNVHAFSLNGELGQCNLVTHSIPLKESARPLTQPPRRLSYHQRGGVETAVRDMWQQGVIRPSSSPWSSPIVPVLKKDGSLRLCVDYRRLNDVTHGDAHPIPRVDDCLDSLSGAVWFHTLDLRSGYWQQGLEEGDKEKTAFSTHLGLFEFNRMPFGLKGAPASFQRLMMAVLAGLTWRECLVYLDDIVVFGKSFGESLQRLEHVLEAISDSGLKLHPEKCVMFKREVKFLGHVINEGGISTDPEKVRVVQEYPRPASVHEVRQFVGLASYFRKFIPSFSEVAKPLLRLTEAKARFQWDDSCEESFLALKGFLISAPVLAFPDFQKDFVLTTDASTVGIGAVLSQRVDGLERPVAYASRCLSKAEMSYSVTERECLAVVWAVRHFSVYLQGRSFTLITDHCPLTYLRSCKDPRGRLARWILELEQYSYTMVYKAGRKIGHADALSRAVREVHLRSDTQDLLRLQMSDADFLMIASCLASGLPCPSDASSVVKFYLSRRDSLEVDRGTGLLFTTHEGHRQLLVPPAGVRQVLHESHDTQCSGHLGIDKTLSRLRDRFHWPSMARDVATYVKSCVPCSQRKSPAPQPRASFGKMPVPSGPWQWVSVDVTGPFPVTADGNRYILVVTCGFSKWVEAFSMPNQEAGTVARILVDRLFCRYGCPETIHSDQGRNFESRLFQEVCKHMGISKTRTSAYHPQGNGQVERFNRTLCSMLSMFVSGDQRNWDEVLPKVVFAYNTSVHKSTNMTPFSVFFGRSARLPLDVVCHADKCPAAPVACGVDQNQIREKVGKAIQEAAALRAASRTDQVNQLTYQVGDFIWVHKPVRTVGKSPKLQRPWSGPFMVMEILSPQSYRVKEEGSRKSFVVHHDRIKPCTCREDDGYVVLAQSPEIPHDASTGGAGHSPLSDGEPEVPGAQSDSDGEIPGARSDTGATRARPSGAGPAHDSDLELTVPQLTVMGSVPSTAVGVPEDSTDGRVQAVVDAGRTELPRDDEGTGGSSPVTGATPVARCGGSDHDEPGLALIGEGAVVRRREDNRDAAETQPGEAESVPEAVGEGGGTDSHSSVSESRPVTDVPRRGTRSRACPDRFGEWIYF